MKILFITIGFAPYSFSESLCNSKLVLAMQEKGWDIDVISRRDNGTNYSVEWGEPWSRLKAITHHVEYPLGNKIWRFVDIVKSSIKMDCFFIEGIRWAAHAYDLACKLCDGKKYDVIMTRSPSDIPHIVGYKLSKKTGIKWISNWNDPAATIWPEPYTYHFSKRKLRTLRRYERLCLMNSDAITYPAETLGSIFKKTYSFLSKKLCMEIPHIALIEGIVQQKKYEKQKIFSLCHSGNLSIERNPENIFRAIRELIDELNICMRFDIMGYANEFVLQLVSKYHLEKTVHFIGSYSYIEAMGILQNYDVLVLIEAILDYGIFFPSKLVDYAQSNRPILAVSPINGYVAKTINEYGGGIAVDNTQYKQIKNGLKMMFDKWNNNTLQSDYDLVTLKDHYNTDSVIDQYMTLFQKSDVI